jgi:1-acyl-sn-glycerol-3-phosphate acyltransferase
MVVGRLEVKGLEHIPIKGGIIIASNHLSYIDPPLLATILPRRCNFMAKHELFDIPILKYLIRYYAFPINRQRPRVSAIKTAIHKLCNGEIVVIFPEGSRNIGATLLSPKNGIGMVALLSKMNVVPTLIEGTDKLFPPGKCIPRLARIRITFGKPLDPVREDTDYRVISRKIMSYITQMTVTKTLGA